MGRGGHGVLESLHGGGAPTRPGAKPGPRPRPRRRGPAPAYPAPCAKPCCVPASRSCRASPRPTRCTPPRRSKAPTRQRLGGHGHGHDPRQLRVLRAAGVLVRPGLSGPAPVPRGAAPDRAARLLDRRGPRRAARPAGARLLRRRSVRHPGARHLRDPSGPRRDRRHGRHRGRVPSRPGLRPGERGRAARDDGSRVEPEPGCRGARAAARGAGVARRRSSPVAEPVAPPSPTPAPSSSPGAPTDAGGCACGVGRHALPRRLEALVLLGLFGAIRRSRRR